jgi:hypothetical protein
MVSPLAAGAASSADASSAGAAYPPASAAGAASVPASGVLPHPAKSVAVIAAESNKLINFFFINHILLIMLFCAFFSICAIGCSIQVYYAI